ncbi:MAG: nucleotidyltransferase family protein [Deltaproteobacteria bacterium]|nr:nucleotidyltransferase family protein [Deltaproteobacteria bacterium]
MAVIDLTIYPAFVLPVPHHAIKLPSHPLPFWWADPYHRYLLELGFSHRDLKQEELNWLEQNLNALMARYASRRILYLIAEWKRKSFETHPVLRDKFLEFSTLRLRRNQEIIQSLTLLLKELEKREIPSLLLKGSALIKKIPQAIHYRVIGDIDFFIPEKHVPEVVNHLRNLDYKMDSKMFFGTMFSSVESVLPFRHAIDFVAPENRVVHDLHWHLCPQAPNTEFDKLLGAFERARIPESANKTLDASEMLLLSIVHALGDRWNQPQSHWAIDALSLARFCSEELDWKKVFWIAKRVKYVSFIQAAIQFLKEIDPELIPEPIIKKSKRLHVSWIERIDRFFLTLMRRNVELRGLSRFYLGIYRAQFFKSNGLRRKTLRSYIYYFCRTESHKEIKLRFDNYLNRVLIPELRKVFPIKRFFPESSHT